MQLAKHKSWLVALLAMAVMLVIAAPAMADQGSSIASDAGSTAAAAPNQSTDAPAALVSKAADQGTGQQGHATAQTSPSADQAPAAPNPAGQTPTPADTGGPAQTPGDAGSQAQSPADTTSQGQSPTVPGQTQAQTGTIGQPQTPGDATSQPQAPAHGQSGTPGGTASQSQAPADANSQAQAPADTTNQSQTPDAGLRQPNSTVQQIWQVQTLGCTAHCQGASQTQSAQQVNLTVEPAGPGDSSSTPSDSGSRHQTNVTQIQLGCLADCFGSSTVADGAGGGADALGQLVNSLAPPNLPTMDPVSAPGQGAVQQSSYQSEAGQSSQFQSATQTNVLLLDPIPSLTSLFSGDPDISSAMSPLGSWVASLGVGGDSPESPQTSSSATTGQVINQVEQAIWQIQIGCLIFCSQTDQTQEAKQSDTTIGVIPSTDPAAADPNPASPITDSYRLVWQLQIGCLFWCYDTIQTQIASIVSTVETVFFPPPPSSGPGGGGTSSGGGGTSSGSGGTSSGSGGTPTPGGPGTPGSTPANGSQSGSSTAEVAPIGSGAAPTLMTSPPAGLITSAPAVSSEISGPVRRRGKRDTISHPHLTQAVLPVVGAPPSIAQIPAAAPASGVASRTLQLGAGAVVPADAVAATRTEKIARGKRSQRGERSHHSGLSNPAPPQLLANQSQTSWVLIGFLTLAALVAAGLIGSDLRERRANRLS